MLLVNSSFKKLPKGTFSSLGQLLRLSSCLNIPWEGGFRTQWKGDGFWPPSVTGLASHLMWESSQHWLGSCRMHLEVLVLPVLITHAITDTKERKQNMGEHEERGVRSKTKLANWILFLICADVQRIVSNTSLFYIQHHNVPRLCFLKMITVLLKSQLGKSQILANFKIKIQSRVKCQFFILPPPPAKIIDQKSVLALASAPGYAHLHSWAKAQKRWSPCPLTAAHLDIDRGYQPPPHTYE